jgi:hypothetical protein
LKNLSLVLFALVCGVAYGQPSDPTLTFEVASVKASPPIPPNGSFRVGCTGGSGATGGRLGGVTQAAEINLQAATYQRALAQGLDFHMKFKRDPAAVAVRIEVVDERGRSVGSPTVLLPPPLGKACNPILKSCGAGLMDPRRWGNSLLTSTLFSTNYLVWRRICGKCRTQPTLSMSPGWRACL